jgi:hypothetical protein
MSHVCRWSYPLPCRRNKFASTDTSSNLLPNTIGTTAPTAVVAPPVGRMRARR